MIAELAQLLLEINCLHSSSTPNPFPPALFPIRSPRSSGWDRLPERGFGAPIFRAPSGSACAGKLVDDLPKLRSKPARRFRLRLRYLDERFRNNVPIANGSYESRSKERGGSRYPASSTTLDTEIGRNILLARLATACRLQQAPFARKVGAGRGQLFVARSSKMACINLVLAPRPDSRRAPNNWYVISESLV